MMQKLNIIRDIKKCKSIKNNTNNIKTLLIFDDLIDRVLETNVYCRGRQNNCKMVYFNQRLFSTDR